MRLGYFIISFYKERVFVKKLMFLFLFGLFSLNLFAELPIVRAVNDGDLGMVFELVDIVGVDLNILTKREYKDYTETLLHRAIHDDEPEIVQFLIEKFKEKGISIDKMGTSKESALMYACSLSLHKYVKILIKNGADVNFDNGEGVTPFMCAVFGGRVENSIKCLNLLKKAGVRLSLSCDELDGFREGVYEHEIWPFIRKNMTFFCKLKYLLWRALPDGDNSN